MVQMIHNKSEKNFECVRRKDRGSTKHDDIDSDKMNKLIKKFGISRGKRKGNDRHMKKI